MASSVKSPYDINRTVVIEYDDGDITLESVNPYVIVTTDDSQYTVKDGDTLQSIANLYYGDSGLWYIIAMANDIDNPFDEEQFYHGQLLRIPAYGGN